MTKKPDDPDTEVINMRDWELLQAYAIADTIGPDQLNLWTKESVGLGNHQPEDLPPAAPANILLEILAPQSPNAIYTDGVPNKALMKPYPNVYQPQSIGTLEPLSTGSLLHIYRLLEAPDLLWSNLHWRLRSD